MLKDGELLRIIKAFDWMFTNYFVYIKRGNTWMDIDLDEFDTISDEEAIEIMNEMEELKGDGCEFARIHVGEYEFKIISR